MGNCGSNPKTKEGPEPVPEPVTVNEEVKVEQQGKEITTDPNVGTKTEETPNEDNKSLGSLLNENVEESKKTEEVTAEAQEVKAEPKEVKAEPKEVKFEAQEVKTEPKQEEPKTTTEEVKVQEEKPKTEEAKTVA